MPSLEDPQGLLTHTKFLQHLFQTFSPPQKVGWVQQRNPTLNDVAMVNLILYLHTDCVGSRNTGQVTNLTFIDC